MITGIIEFANDEGAMVFPGEGRQGCYVYYCGRNLGTAKIPYSDGICGPSSGPSCSSCQRFMTETHGGFHPFHNKGDHILGLCPKDESWLCDGKAECLGTRGGRGQRRYKCLGPHSSSISFFFPSLLEDSHSWNHCGCDFDVCGACWDARATLTAPVSEGSAASAPSLVETPLHAEAEEDPQ
jgi:hypothetical protein